MAIPAALMSLFGVKTPAPAGTENVNNTVPSATTSVPTGSPAAFPAVGTGNESPLEGFKELWKVDPTAPQPTPVASLIPNFNLDGKMLMEQAGKIDFTSHINPELVTKAMSGDAASFLEVINQASRFGFANSSAATAKLIEGSLGNAQIALNDSVIPSAIRREQISSAINANNPIFADPAVAPMMGMLQQQLTTKYPTASSAEIATMAARYLDGMASSIVSAKGGSISTPAQTRQANAQKEPDWMELLKS